VALVSRPVADAARHMVQVHPQLKHRSNARLPSTSSASSGGNPTLTMRVRSREQGPCT
jgi:hypothetical protein